MTGVQTCALRSLQQVARPDGPRGDAVDARVKIIQSDVDALFKTIRHNLSRDGEQVVVQDDNMVAVPTNATADVQQNLRQILHHAGNFIRDAFGRVIMAGVEAEEFFARDRVAEVKFVRTDDVTFTADAEQLRLNGVEVELG